MDGSQALPASAIGSNGYERRAIIPPQLIDPRIRSIERAQAISARLYRNDAVCLPIDQNGIAQETCHSFMHAEYVLQLIAGGEPPVLNYDGHVVFTIG